MGTWRLEPKVKTQGTYYVLVRGKARERISLALRYVPKTEAESALHTLQREETAGTVSRILAMHRENPDAAVRYLIGDPAFGELMPEPTLDYGGMFIREYHDAVYTPWRKDDRPRTWRSEQGHWVRILRELGHHRLRKIDAHIVADYLDQLTVERESYHRHGEPVSGSTKRLHRAALQSLLLRAERLKHIERAPDLARFRIRGSTIPTRVKPPPLTLDELSRLLDASDPLHRAMWAVGVGEGLRPSELQRLCWDDVRWSSRTLQIRGDDSGRGKTDESVAEIPLTPIALRELRAWWMANGQPATGHCFLSRYKKPFISGSGYKKSLAAAAEAAGIPHQVTPYLLRDSFATIAWSIGIEKDVARRVLRHTDEKMLDEVYCRPRPQDLVDRVSQFDV